MEDFKKTVVHLEKPTAKKEELKIREEGLRKTNTQLYKETCLRATHRQVSERNRTDKKLGENEEKYRRMVESTVDWIWSIDLDGRFTFTNAAVKNLLGYEVHEIQGSSSFSAIHPDDQKYIQDLYHKAVERKRGWKNAVIRWVHKNGSVRFCESIAWPVLDSEGNLIEFSGIDRDITKRKEVEDQLKETTDYLENVFENSADAIGIVDKHGKFVKWSKAAEEFYGYSFEEIQGVRAFDLYADKSELERMLERLRQDGFVRAYEINMKRKDGSVVPFAHSISLLKDMNGNAVGSVCVTRDLRNQKKMQAQLFQAQKMEAVGTLAGGVAHDFRNILQIVQGYTELLLLDKNEDEKDYDILHEILIAAKRAAQLCKQLLTFSRRVESERRPIDLNREVENVRSLLVRTLPKMIKIELRLEENLNTINADPTQLEQVLLNLAVNAKDAMPEGGKFLIETKNVSLDDEYCEIHPGAKPGKYVLLSISDTGQGMDGETVRHIFEPFYTTKEVGRGTGLGLAMVYGIVKSHGGYVMCYSQLGEGSTFKIYFPVLEQKKPLDKVEKVEVPLVGGNETLLIVDDEDSLRILAQEILERYGYTTIFAADGESAIELYKQERDRIDLVILDLIMPGLGGRKCLEKLLEIEPKARVIITSGFPPDGVTRKTLESGAMGFIDKPYVINQMLHEVRRVLDADYPLPGGA